MQVPLARLAVVVQLRQLGVVIEAPLRLRL